MILSEKSLVSLINSIELGYPNMIDFTMLIQTKELPSTLFDTVNNSVIDGHIDKRVLEEIIMKNSDKSRTYIQREDLTQELLEAFIEDLILKYGRKYTIEDRTDEYIIRRIE